MEDYREIRALLADYWEGRTSLAEEQRLRIFFSQSQGNLPADLEPTAALFRFFGQEAEISGEAVPFPDKGSIRQPPRAATAERYAKGPMRIIRHYWEYAAIALLIIGSALWFQIGGNSSGAIQPSADTYQNPKEAFVTTQKALQLIAANLNKSKAEMQKLALFHQATQKVAGHSKD